MFKKGIIYLAAASVLLTGLGMVMANLSAGNRSLVAWLLTLVVTVVFATTFRSWRRRRGGPPPKGQKAKDKARKRDDDQVKIMLACFLMIPVFFWAASTDSAEFDFTTINVFEIGIYGLIAAAVLAALRQRLKSQ